MKKNLKNFFRAFVSFFQYDYELIYHLDRYARDLSYSEYMKANTIIKISEIIKGNWVKETIQELNDCFQRITIRCPLSDDLKNQLYDKIEKSSLYETIIYINNTSLPDIIKKLFIISVINMKIFKVYSIFVSISSQIYDSLILSLQEKDELDRFIEKLIIKEQNNNYKNPILSIDEIKNRILLMPNELKKFLKIEEIRLFGSYANNTQSNESDFDFLVITNDKYYDNDLTKTLLYNFFEEKFGKHFDIVSLDINQKSLNTFEFMVLLKSVEVVKFGVI